MVKQPACPWREKRAYHQWTKEADGSPLGGRTEMIVKRHQKLHQAHRVCQPCPRHGGGR